ncbi:MAG: hypothetical protein N2C12_17340, partial [Planctomycetales bacterium]
MQRFGWVVFVVSCTLFVRMPSALADDDSSVVPGTSLQAAIAAVPATPLEPATAVVPVTDLDFANPASTDEAARRRQLFGELRTRYSQLQELHEAGDSKGAEQLEGEMIMLRVALPAVAPLTLAMADKKSGRSPQVQNMIDKYHQYRELKQAGKEKEAAAALAELKALRKKVGADGWHKHAKSAGRKGHGSKKHGAKKHGSYHGGKHGRGGDKVRAKFVELKKKMQAAKESGNEEEIKAVKKEFRALMARVWHYKHKKGGHGKGKSKCQASGKYQCHKSRGGSPEMRKRFAELRKKWHAAKEAGDEEKLEQIKRKFRGMIAKAYRNKAHDRGYKGCGSKGCGSKRYAHKGCGSKGCGSKRYAHKGYGHKSYGHKGYGHKRYAHKGYGGKGGRGSRSGRSNVDLTAGILSRIASLHLQMQAAKGSGNRREAGRIERDYKHLLMRAVALKGRSSRKGGGPGHYRSRDRRDFHKRGHFGSTQESQHIAQFRKPWHSVRESGDEEKMELLKL